MKIHLTLRTRLFTVVATLGAISILGALLMIWYTLRIETMLNTIIEKNLAAFQSAEALETALINQKGFVSYYFMDGDPKWLQQLGEHRQIFRQRLQEAQNEAENGEQAEALKYIENEYVEYTSGKDEVIELYKTGRREDGARLHKAVRAHYFALLGLCENYKQIHTRRMMVAKQAAHQQAAELRFSAIMAIGGTIVLALLLAFILVRQVLQPVDRLFETTRRDATVGSNGDVMAALSQSVQGLLADVDQTHLELSRSRESLLQAEKLAMVGKLAAGMAHSIRNPFTSVKMRLFSLNRSLQLNHDQKEDFEVITEEIRHIDTIVQNFLEFSRPPKLKMQSVSPSTVVDMALQLLQHRLKSYDVAVAVERTQPLPQVEADPEQLKEVLVNLIINACEAMDKGGHITITEKRVLDRHSRPLAILQVADNGPGIPENLKEKIFQPFFTTKAEGTGLGLSIVERIIREHRGQIELEPKEGVGTTFIITLPIKE